ncbi:hypothetical protein U0070_003168 [Myodes glareolus]|uniref:Uncharacterized protein n=1 Tax=Myodes glareolus TaxID=447135 RepID=A0AAW0I2I0_MYOGA
MNVLADALKSIRKLGVLSRPCSKVINGFLTSMMKHGDIGEFEINNESWENCGVRSQVDQGRAYIITTADQTSSSPPEQLCQLKYRVKGSERNSACDSTSP